MRVRDFLSRRGAGRLVAVALLALSVSGLTTSARADNDVSRPWLRPSPQAQASSSGSSAGRPSWGFAVGSLVLASLVAGALWARRKRKPGLPAGVDGIRVVGATRVGAKAQVVMARVGRRVILLGVTDSQVTSLGWLDEEQTQDELEPRDEEEADVLRESEESSNRRPTPLRAQAREPAPRERPSFRDVLRDALGMSDEPERRELRGRATQPVMPRPTARETLRAHTESPAVTVARGTRDVFVPSARRQAERVPAEPIIDIEGQAAGLLARLAQHRG